MFNNQEIIKRQKEVFDKISKVFDESRIDPWIEILNIVEPSDRIVDLGCGCGSNAKYIFSKSRKQYVGIDISIEMLKKMKTVLNNDHKLDLINADIRYIPLRDKCSDITTCIAAIHHIPSRDYRIKALKEVARITNYRAVISVWRIENICRLRRYLRIRDRDFIVYWSWKLNEKLERFYHLYAKCEIIDEILELQDYRFRLIMYFTYIRKGYINDVIVLDFHVS